jgi:hypothetical protein
MAEKIKERQIVGVICTLLVSSCLLLAPTAHAQDESPPNVADLWIITVDDFPNSTAFEVAFKTHLAARKEAGDPRNWQTYTVVAGGEMDTYGVHYCCFKWADADAYAEWTQSSGILDHWNEHVAQYVDNYSHQFQYFDFDNSTWSGDPTDYRYFGVTSWRLKPGMAGIRQAAIKALSDVGKANEWGISWSWTSPVGGDAVLSLVTPYADFAAMEPPEQSFYEMAVEHLGAEETAQLFNDFGSTFWSSEYAIFERRPDLSMGDGED